MKNVLRILLAYLLIVALSVSVFAAETTDSINTVNIEEEAVKDTAEAWLRMYTENVFLYTEHDLTRLSVASLSASQRNAINFDSQAYKTQTQCAKIMSPTTATDSIDYYLQKAEFFAGVRQAQDITREQYKASYFVDVVSIVGNSASVSAVAQKTFYYTGNDMQTFLAESFDMHLVKINGVWLVYDVTADDCFDSEHKSTNFSAAEALAQFKQEYDISKSAADSPAVLSKIDTTAELEGTVSPNSTTLFHRRPYSRTNAINYAFTYTCISEGLNDCPQNYNTNFYCFNTYYGNERNVDCMNFASQCVYAGFHGSNDTTAINSGAFRKTLLVQRRKQNGLRSRLLPALGLV